ncbi:MAG: pyruvate formate lyase family protein [Armatimonadota bacterium]
MAMILEKYITTAPEWAIDDTEAAILESRGQYYAAGFLRRFDISPCMRFVHAIENHLRHCSLHAYDGELLYPAKGFIWLSPDPPQVLWNFYVDLGRNPSIADQYIADASTIEERRAFEKARLCCVTYPVGGGYTHSIPNYGRVLAEGLDSYRDRILLHMADTDDPEKIDMYESLLLLIDAIDMFRMRIVDFLEAYRFDDPQKEFNRKMLIEVYRSGIPMRPAQSMYEAMVSTIFIYALDGPDNLGRFDQYIRPYYENDISSGKVTRNEAKELISALWKYTDDCSAWNTALGGSTRNGEEASSDLTVLCLEAAQGKRRPNLALRLREDTPDSIWDAAIDTISTGTGLPALYCEGNYLKGIDLAQLNISDEDKRDFAFGGCTELMVNGCSNVGSLDESFSAIKTLEDCLYQYLETSSSFDDFMAAYEKEIQNSIYEITQRVSTHQEIRSKHIPLPMRTLLIDDCIDKGRNYSDGGARCNWSVINIVGLSNAIDSLSAMKKAVYDDKYVSPVELLSALKSNFNGYESLLAYLQKCPRFGNDDPDVNNMADHLSGLIYKEFKRYAPWRGGKFLCGTLMFVTYGWFGEPVGATPDGRLAGTPVGDSAGPVQGRDKIGPTAMLNSTASLQQLHAPGTLVVNLRVSKKLVNTPDGREKLKSLIKTYFKLGGLQLQVNVVDQEVLKDAIEHPENHEHLIIRIGGYSEYFNNLPIELRHTLLERTEYA